ncbi:MAG: hypothetical protein ACLT16_16095 [[Clostridium] innocuum]
MKQENQFQNTLSLGTNAGLIMPLRFLSIRREGTPAASMADNVELAVKQRRLQELNERWNRMRVKRTRNIWEVLSKCWWMVQARRIRKCSAVTRKPISW